MVVNTAQAIRAIVTFGLFAWLLFLVARAPKNQPLRAIFLLIVSWAVSFPFGNAADAGQGILGLDPMVCQLIATVLQTFGMYSLVCFILFTAYQAPDARRRAWRQLPVPVVVSIILTFTVLTTPLAMRAAAARVITDALEAHYASTVPSIGAFYFFSNIYSVYACGFALLVTCRYARQGPDRRLRQGMILAAAGLILILFALSTFVVANVFLWAGHSEALPSIIVVIGTICSFVGLVVFIAGLAYRSVTMRLTAIRVWWQHLWAYHHLRPLWTSLHAEFPEDTLDRAPTTLWRGVISLRGVHRRYYRRVIECRDGLVRLSPYLADAAYDGQEPPTIVAQRIRDALQAHSVGATVPSQPVLIAAPAEQGLDADVIQLVALARALRAN